MGRARGRAGRPRRRRYGSPTGTTSSSSTIRRRRASRTARATRTRIRCATRSTGASIASCTRARRAAKQMSLSMDRPAELVRRCKHDNLFWRLTAQRLLVERGQADVASQLYRLARDRSADELGLNPGALHALWTLHGLGLLNGSNAQATDVATAALRHPAAAVRKAAVQVLPANATTLARAALGRTAPGPRPHARGSRRCSCSRSSPRRRSWASCSTRSARLAEVEQDEWLSQAVYVAAAKHKPGYLKAYRGRARRRAVSRARAAARAGRVDAARAAGAAGASRARAARRAPPPLRPVAERLLRAYVEDVVGSDHASQRRTRIPLDESRRTRRRSSSTVSVCAGQMKFSLPVVHGEAGPARAPHPHEPGRDAAQPRSSSSRARSKQSGALADAMARTPDAAERNYIPPTPDVMSATKLVDPGETFTLEFIGAAADGGLSVRLHVPRALADHAGHDEGRAIIEPTAPATRAPSHAPRS